MTELTQDVMLSKISLLSDEPDCSGDFFNFKEYADQIYKILNSQNMISPFTIAIHADWGMGKTTLLRMIMRKFDNYSSDKKKIEFNAWEYERSDIVTSLLIKIEKKLKDEEPCLLEKLGKDITTLALDIMLRKTVNMSIEDAKLHFANHDKSISTLRETLEQLTKKIKLIIFIDDLDRCSADNILDMLESLKMFFNVKNIIVVMAVDITKIERAWELRYDSRIGKIEGREHIEKLFQLKLALPPKSDEDLFLYVEKLTGSLVESDIRFILQNAQSNPRKIKRMLNLLYIILLNLPKRGTSNEDKNKKFKIDFRMILGWIALTLNHPDIAKKIQLSPSYLIRISIICNKLESLNELKNFLDVFERDLNANPWVYEKLEVARNIMHEKGIHELLMDIKNEPVSFKIIKHFADQFDLASDTNRFIMNDETIKKIDDEFYPPLNEIIKRSGLIGV